MKKKVFYVFAVIALSLGWWQSAGFWLRSLGPDWLIALPIVAWLFASALALSAASVRYSGWIYAGLLVLALSSLPLLSLLSGVFADQQSPPWGYAASFMTHPVALLIVLLLYSGLTAQARRTMGTPEGDVSRAERQQAERAGAIVVLSALTLVCWEVIASILGHGLFPLNPLSWLITLAAVVLLVSAMALGARRVGDGVWILVALLLLPGLSLPASVVNDIFTASPEATARAHIDALCGFAHYGLALALGPERLQRMAASERGGGWTLTGPAQARWQSCSGRVFRGRSLARQDTSPFLLVHGLGQRL